MSDLEQLAAVVRRSRWSSRRRRRAIPRDALALVGMVAALVLALAALPVALKLNRELGALLVALAVAGWWLSLLLLRRGSRYRLKRK